MYVDLELKNYRSFTDAKPARISLRPGFTAFVGVNNSGKSSLLKLFYELRSLFGWLGSPNGELLNALAGQPTSSSIPTADVFSDFTDRDLEIRFQVPPTDAASGEAGAPVVRSGRIRISRTTYQWSLELDGLSRSIAGNPPLFDGTELHVQGYDPPLGDLSAVFAMGNALAQALYIGPFRNAINVGSNAAYYDISVGQAMIQAWRNWKTGPDKRANEAAYRLTQDIQRIFGFQDLEINPSPDDQTLQVFIDGRSYRLPELGSGLTQFFLVLASAATRRPSYILIDEPELNLHPSLQLDFLTTLTSYARYGVVFATHSIGLARAVGNTVYSVRKNPGEPSEVSPYEATPRLSEFLGELSFSSYKELGFEKILLVEGATEVQTIQQFLRLFGKEHRVVLLPLGGASLINDKAEPQLREIKRISDEVYALIDSERTGPSDPLAKDRAGFQAACQRVGITCHVLDRRAIENYLPDRAVKKIKGDKYRALGSYELLKAASSPWAKAENWRIAREMTREELEQTDLGQFIANQL